MKHVLPAALGAIAGSAVTLWLAQRIGTAPTDHIPYGVDLAGRTVYVDRLPHYRDGSSGYGTPPPLFERSRKSDFRPLPFRRAEGGRA